MYIVKYQNLSGDWFESEFPFSGAASVVFEWKKTGGVCKIVQLWENNVLVITWSKDNANN